MSKSSMAFGKTIREARERFGLSQEALAASAGLNRTFLGEIERGETNPSLETICRLAEALKMRPSELVRNYEKCTF